MAKRELWELRQMQALPLKVKILLTKARIRDWVNEYGKDGVYVSFSGGKDSTVLLTIAREAYPNIKACYSDTGLEYPEVRDFVKTWDNVDWVKPKKTFRQVIEDYGYPFISKEVAERVYYAQRYLAWYRQTDRQTDRWDLIIAHPPCTYLTVTGNRSFSTERYGKKAEERWKKRVDAAVFFMRFAGADCDRIAIENPIGIMSTSYRKPDQIIHPWMFALEEYEKTEKSTCLWLKGLPKLRPLHTEKPEIAYKEWTDKNGRHKRQTLWYYQTRCLAHEERAKAASKTFPGVAAAFAEQWG